MTRNSGTAPQRCSLKQPTQTAVASPCKQDALLPTEARRNTKNKKIETTPSRLSSVQRPHPRASPSIAPRISVRTKKQNSRPSSESHAAPPPQERQPHPMAAPLRNTSLTGPLPRSLPGASVRRITTFGPANAPAQPVARPPAEAAPGRQQPLPDALLLRRVKSETRSSLPRTYFESTGAVRGRGDQPPDPNKAKLGRSK